MSNALDTPFNLLEKLQPSTPIERARFVADGGNCFCSVHLPSTMVKVILYFTEGQPLGHLLQKRCRDNDYATSLVHTEDKAIDECLNTRHSVLVVVDTDQKSVAGVGPLEHLSESIYSKGLHDNVKFLAVVKSYSFYTTRDIPPGVTRVLTEEDCRSNQFLLALKLWERIEASLQKKIMLGHVFFEAVDQSNDAIQITGSDSNIIYVNRAFADLSGYSRDEVIGKPATDILRPFDSKTDNGPSKLATNKVQRWDGVCMGRRKSGSVLKQHIKLIPIQTNERNCQINYHVTIQRLLSSHHDSDHSKLSSPKYNSGTPDRLQLSTRQQSLGSIPNLGSQLEIPITKVVQVLTTARDNLATPGEVKEALERAMEILCSAELFSPVPGSQGGVKKNYKGIVDGLLQSGRRFSVTNVDTLRIAHPHSHFTRNPPITPPPPEVQDAIQNIDVWEFDIINLEKLSCNEPLYYIGMKVFNMFEVCDILDIEESVLASWLKLMENNYRRPNAYHNSTHAADVLQATAYFIKILQDNLVSQGDMLERLEIAALLITAVIHDLDHPGRTNPFLCNIKHELSTLYNDCAVLENHHVALSFKLTQQSKEINIYQNLEGGTYRSLRSSIIDLVMATDMAKHFEHLAKFTMYSVDSESASTTSLTSKDSRESRMVMKRILVKCADISNPCRPSKLCKQWAKRIAEEYFSQTEEEKDRNIPVIFPDFDRDTCKLPVTQVKFIDYFISGLFDAWHNFCPVPLVMDYLKSNYESWKDQIPDSPSPASGED